MEGIRDFAFRNGVVACKGLAQLTPVTRVVTLNVQPVAVSEPNDPWPIHTRTPVTSAACGNFSYWSRICFGSSTRCRCGVGSGMEPTQNVAVAPKPRHTMLPLLVVLFLISYVLLTTLVVMQDRTIDSQRSLIHLLFSDNLRLVATKVGLHRDQATGSNQNTATGRVPKQTSSSQVSAAQTPSAQVPVIQAKPQASAKSGRNARKAQKALPARPPVEMTDPSDM